VLHQCLILLGVGVCMYVCVWACTYTYVSLVCWNSGASRRVSTHVFSHVFHRCLVLLFVCGCVDVCLGGCM
jgi:hypothetical protein